MAAAHDPRRLRNYEFTDLYLASYKSGVPMASQLRCPPSVLRQPNYGVSHLPTEAHDDAFQLWMAVQERWASSDWKPEFPITHDGVTYRCALIDSPNSLSFANGTRNLTEPKRVWCLRRHSATASRLAQTGLPKWLVQELRHLGNERGLLLVSGAFFSGKSTTAGAILTEWVRELGGVAVSIEDPIELPLAGQFPNGAIYQIQADEDQFGAAIKRGRRYGLRYLMLQEIRTAKAASELIHIATGGPMTITTIHANSPVEALMSVSKWAEVETGESIARQMLSTSLKGVLHQTLRNGQLYAEYLSVTGENDFAIRQKIRLGRFDQIAEDLHLQKTQRANGRPI